MVSEPSFFLFGESSWSINRYISIPIGFNSNNPLLYYRKFVNLSNASNQIWWTNERTNERMQRGHKNGKDQTICSDTSNCKIEIDFGYGFCGEPQLNHNMMEMNHKKRSMCCVRLLYQKQNKTKQSDLPSGSSVDTINSVTSFNCHNSTQIEHTHTHTQILKQTFSYWLWLQTKLYIDISFEFHHLNGSTFYILHTLQNFTVSLFNSFLSWRFWTPTRTSKPPPPPSSSSSSSPSFIIDPNLWKHPIHIHINVLSLLICVSIFSVLDVNRLFLSSICVCMNICNYRQISAIEFTPTQFCSGRTRSLLSSLCLSIDFRFPLLYLFSIHALFLSVSLLYIRLGIFIIIIIITIN